MAKERITKEDVMHAASLARLKLTKEEIDTFGTELAMILEFVAKLEKVNIENVVSTNYGGFLGNSYREDILPKEKKDNKKLLPGAFPDTKDNMLKVPHVLTQEGENL